MPERERASSGATEGRLNRARRRFGRTEAVPTSQTDQMAPSEGASAVTHDGWRKDWRSGSEGIDSLRVVEVARRIGTSSH